MVQQPTRELGSFISQLEYEDIPKTCISKVKLLLLDAIGCGLFGSTTPWASIVNGVVKGESGNPESTLWGNSGFKGPSLLIALGNGTMVHSFDFDDYHNSKTHPGSVVIPSAMAAGEPEGVDGKRFLTAVVAGYEVMIRASLATGPQFSRERGWHLTGTCGTFGAAAAASVIMGLNEEQATSALGLAGTQSSGLWAFIEDGAMSKRFHPGKAAQNGILAVKLAKAGFTGASRIFEAADGGFCKATSDSFDLTRLTCRLGEIFHAADTNIKPYAACGSNHSSIDAALVIVSENDIKPRDIEKIVVYNSRNVILQTGWDYKPISPLQAQMSLKYNVAVAIIDGQVLVDQFTDERIKAPDVMELAAKVHVVVDEDIDAGYPEKFSSKVEIILKDKKSYFAFVEHPLGSAQNPVTEENVAQKFMSMTKGSIPAYQQQKIVETVKNIDALPDINLLASLL